MTFVSRSLEPYRGFHVFMRALPAVLAARPQAHVVIVGGDGVSYGARPRDAESWKARLLAEVGGQLDLSRVHFPGRVPYPAFVALIYGRTISLGLTLRRRIPTSVPNPTRAPEKMAVIHSPTGTK